MASGASKPPFAFGVGPTFMTFIGNHLKMTLAHKLREQTKRLYQDVLGCQTLSSPLPDLDLFEFDDGFVLGVFYVEEKDALTEENYAKATWLEIKSKNPEGLKKRLQEFGVREVDYPDKTRFFFQAPGGQVFRLAPLDGGL